MIVGFGLGFPFATSGGGAAALLNPTGGPFGINIIVGTGQSLSVGEQSTASLDEEQPYDNVMLAFGELVPAVCPVRTPGGSGVYPGNLGGPQTCTVPMANQLSEMLGWRFACVEVGESGHDIEWIKKGGTGNAYAGTLTEVQAIFDLATDLGLTCGVVAIACTHGQGDHANATYGAQLTQLLADYQADLSAITGQSHPIVMLLAQQSTHNTIVGPSLSTIVPLQLMTASPASFIALPIYQLPYFTDGVHMMQEGYQRLGIEYALAYAAHVADETPALVPTGATRDGSTITVTFEVPTLPLVWDGVLAAPHPATAFWSAGKGFEVIDGSGFAATIESVTIDGSTVIIECDADPGNGAVVHYARYQDSTGYNGGKAPGRRGLLRDSRSVTDYVGDTGHANWCCNFTLAL